MRVCGLVIIICLLYSALTLQMINYQKIALGARVANSRLTQRDPAQAKQELDAEWESVINGNLEMRYRDKIYISSFADLGFQVDTQAMIKSLYGIGRQPSYFTGLKEQFFALLGWYNLAPHIVFNKSQFNDKLNGLFQDFERPAQNASLEFSEETEDFVLVHATEGLTVDRGKLSADLLQNIKSSSAPPIELRVSIEEPSVKNDEVDEAKEQARHAISNLPYYLTLDGDRWTIKKNTLLGWLKFEPVKDPVRSPASNGVKNNSDNYVLGVDLDREKAEEYLAKINWGINQAPVSAQIETEGNYASLFVVQENGYGIKFDRTIDNLLANIMADPPVKTTKIIADKTLPEITLRQTNDLGINQLVGEGQSDFSGSSASRIHNIKTGAAKLNYLILDPEEEFSFNNLLGPSGPEEGYLPEQVIKGNEIALEYGGGLCQLSTTLFRAAVNTGLRVTERQPHAFPVAYYSPHGFDATVYSPRPDLRFVNDTPGHLLMEIFTEGNQLYVNLYGTDDGRVVEIEGPNVLESNEDGSMKTVLIQRVYKDGELLREREFYSNYKSPNLFPKAEAE